MAITIQLYQDTGAVVSGHGTTRIPVTNIGWKSNGTDETNSYVFYPINRPEDVATPFGYSFKQYHYIKISGAYPAGSRLRFNISGGVNATRPAGYEGSGSARLFYKLTNTYQVPDDTFDGSMIFLPSGTTQMIYPTVSTTGPEAATSYIKHLAQDTTYYTQYLVTQLFVDQGLETEFGNIGELHITALVDEYESTDT